MGGRVPRWTQRSRVRPGEGWAPSGCTLPVTHHVMKTSNHTILDRSPPGSTRTAPFAVHQDGGVKYATGASPKIRGRDNITIGTWNTRTLRAAGKPQELTHEMDRYRWNILGLCDGWWKNVGEKAVKKDSRSSSVENMINKSMALDFLFTRISWTLSWDVAQSPAGSSSSAWGQSLLTSQFCDQLQNVIDQTPKKDILVVQGDWNAQVGKDACENRQGICGPFCNDNTNERGLRLLEFATFDDLVLANTVCHHKASRRWTWHSPNWHHHNQIDYILVRKRFRSGVNSAITRTHDLLIMTFHHRLKRISKPKHTRLKFDLEKLKDPKVLEIFQAMIGGRFGLHLSPSWTMKMQTWLQWSPPSTQQWLKQPVRSLANSVRI